MTNFVGADTSGTGKRTLLGGTALWALVAAAAATSLPTRAYAQETQADQPPPQALQSETEIESGRDVKCDNLPAGTPRPADCEAIVVTGSRIARPNLESPLPVTSVSGEEFFKSGNVSIGDQLNQLPAIRSTFTQANSTRFLGTGGLNQLDLRGLNPVRTLVLVNGRRHVGGDVLGSGVTVDTNTIPTDLIDRVDVVTGGNSAVYGSDAIAGVVNFVLKQDYNGFMVRGQGGQSTYGDANAYFISGLAGKNFADGRGNVAVNFEYAHRSQAWGADRKWLRDALAIVDSDPPGTPNGSDGVPDRILNPDFRSATFNNTGFIRIGGPSSSGAPSGLSCGLDPQGNQYRCTYIFQPNGQLVPQTGSRIGLGPSGQFIGGNGEGFFDGHQIQVQPKLNRYSATLVGHFEITPALVPFIEGTFSRTDSSSTGAAGPNFITGSRFSDPMQFFIANGNRERIALNNPFLDPAAAATIKNAILASGVNACNFAPLTATDLARLANNTFRFCSQQNLPSLGNRTEDFRRDTFRIVGGVRGDFAGDWHYEASLNYGQLKERNKITGNIDVQRYLLGADAVRDPATGNIVCASQIDPSRAFGYYPWLYGTDPNADARLANDIASCVPFSPLGGHMTQAQIDYLTLDTVANGKLKQFDAMAFVSGDTSKWFELPGGPIGIVLGAEYRTDDKFYNQDPQVSLGYTRYNPIPTFNAPASKVKEAFGEIRLPILKDLPFAHELEISGAARVSDYSLGSTGTVWAYNGNVIYSPVDGLRLRGNYARSVRAPNQTELFSPLGQNFSLITDPCDVNSVGAGSQNRAANCIAAGVPAGTRINYPSSLPFLSGGNVDLAAETSDSITLGGVLTPKIVPGFSASVDYYDIKVKNVITAPAAQDIINACYDLPSINNQFCDLFQRAGPGEVGHGDQPFGIIDNSLSVTPLNYAALKARGIDFEFAYRRSLGEIGRFDTRFIWTHVLERTDFLDPTNPKFGDRVLSELGDPQDKFQWASSLKHGRFTFGYTLRYVGKMTVSAYEDTHSFQGRPPQNADFANRVWYPTRWYHSVNLDTEIGPRYNFYVGVDNLTNAKPPYDTSGIGGGSGIYDSIGRFFYAGFKAKF